MTVELTPEQEFLVKQQAFEQGTLVAQIFSGIFFSGLTAWLTVANGTSLSFVQRASLEKRLTVCCGISTYVGFFSAFFNFFQLTDVDDALLPHKEGEAAFNMDLARPIEWVLTCPLMQLTLVLMGGSKLPDYRRFVMPMFSVSILSMGTTSTFMDSFGLKTLCYVCGVCTFVAMATFNRLQILEYSNGSEGLLQGDSEFRKATVLLLVTWFPFPCWFSVSPEGFGIIDNVLIIQVGWAFLNIVSKFAFIFYIQRIKDMYCNRLKCKREMGVKPGSAFQPKHGAMTPDLDFNGMLPGIEDAHAFEQADYERKKEKLSGIVVETMAFLGMAQNTDRFQRLLDSANINDVDAVENLTKEDCNRLSLPLELVTALQRRVQFWKLEMVDDAELGLEKGEEHYLKKMMEVPKMEPIVMHAQQRYYAQGVHGMMPNMVPTPDAHVNAANGTICDAPAMIDHSKIEEMLSKTEQNLSEKQTQSAQNWEMALSKLIAHMDAIERRLSEALEATCKTAEIRSELRNFESRVHQRLDEIATEQQESILAIEGRLCSQVEKHISGIQSKVDLCSQKIEKNDGLTKVSTGIDALLQRAENLQVQQAKFAADSDSAWRSRFQALETSILCRDDEHEIVNRKRFEDLMKQSVAKRVDELLAQLQKLGERSDSGIEAMGNGMQMEVQTLGRKLVERDDRQARRLEELLDMATTRSVQKTEDVGTHMAKELHGFARRLNAKIPFM